MVRSRVCSHPSGPYVRGTIGFGSELLDIGALACALVAGSSHDGRALGGVMPLGLVRSMYEAFMDVVESATDPSRSGETHYGLDTDVILTDDRRRADAYIRALDRLPSWTVFRTKSGYIGRGPPLLREGDKVCAFLGGKTPFIVRKAATPWLALYNRFHLVGECYVRGLMSREVMRMSLWRWKTIALL